MKAGHQEKAGSENPARVLLEIGTEEIPARFLPKAISDLRELAASRLREYRIGFEEIRTYATPRRLALIATGVEPMQTDITKEIFGPSKKAAFDENGNPTKAAAGFAASLGLDTSSLVVRMKGKGEYIAAIKEEKGAETKTVLPKALKEIILSLHFPKAMRWASGTFSFVRPIHWIAALYSSEVLNFEIDGIQSGNMTRGHRFLSPASFQVRDISSYMSLLENNFVILDPEKRKTIIRKGLSALAETAEGEPLADEELVETVAFLSEYPTPVLCAFSEEYLELPKELLITVMKDHQKYFAIKRGDSLLNRFVVISNTLAENSDTVRTGAERVIRARFDDAKFYFHEDRKKALADRVEDLRKVTFHDRLGTLFDKTERVRALASFLAGRLSPGLKENRAALLSKTDLITGVVREFPELQGIMGKYYAAFDGEEKSVAEALEEQYLPKYFGGTLPKTEAGALLSIADKADNLGSFFAINLIPTGSEDPFGLRRQAMGIISIMLDKGYEISLKEIFVLALGQVEHLKPRQNVIDDIISFMEQRIEFVLSSAGYEQDLIKSVLSVSVETPLQKVDATLKALRQFRNSPGFPDFLLAIKRVNNILPKTPLRRIDEGLLLQEEEKALFRALSAAKESVMPLLKEGEFLTGLEAFAAITPSVNAFFDKVLVMDKNEDIKANRLALLGEIWSAALRFADFSKLA